MATQFGAEYEEIGYEGTIENEDGGFVLLPDGDYDFTVNKITRSRYEGSAKMPSCNTVSVELTVWGAGGDSATITERFFLVKKFEWKLSQFFLSIGLKKHGEQLVMRWNIEGYKGKCKVYIDNYKKQDGSDGQSNKIKKFYAYDENVRTVSSTAPSPQQQYQASPQQQYQQQYQQTYQQYQTPTQQSTWQQPTQSSSGWAAGKF
jgi:hypothetical protein